MHEVPVGANKPESPSCCYLCYCLWDQNDGVWREAGWGWQGNMSALVGWASQLSYYSGATSGIFLCSLQQKESCSWNQLSQELWLCQVSEVLMPEEAEGLEPDNRAGGTVASTVLNMVPSAATKSGITVCFAALAVQYDHPSVSAPALCLLAPASLYPTFMCCSKQWSPILLWNQALVQIMTRFRQSPQALSCSYPEAEAPEGSHWLQEFWRVQPLAEAHGLAILPVPAQCVAPGTGANAPLHLGQISYFGESWTCGALSLGENHLGVCCRVAKLISFSLLSRGFQEVACEWAASTEQLTPCQFSSGFTPE